jgi:DHA3 family macrolide efflux protein-like MFS transporter
VSFLVMAVLLLWVRLPQRVVPAERRPNLLVDVRSGLRLMRRSRILVLAPVIALLLNATLAPVTVILPKLLATLGAGAAGYGTFLALESAGMLLAGLLIVTLGDRLPPRWTILAGLALTAGTYAAMWQWPQTGALLGWAAALGFGFGLINTPFQTLLHQLVPEAYLGRVFSVLGTVSSIGMPLSLLVLSPVLDRAPMPLWFGLAALAQGSGASCGSGECAPNSADRPWGERDHAATGRGETSTISADARSRTCPAEA